MKRSDQQQKDTLYHENRPAGVELNPFASGISRTDLTLGSKVIFKLFDSKRELFYG
jgi:hypothetical protein